jgi:hypothetical protein
MFRFRVIAGNIDGSIGGAVTGINVYSNVDKCTSNEGDVVSWVKFESCARQYDMAVSPSSCPESQCSGLLTTDCNVSGMYL